MKENRKGFYQEIINEIIKQHGKDNFTYRLMGEKLEVSKQRAKQIVDYYQLDIPSYDYFASKECADLKKLIESMRCPSSPFRSSMRRDTSASCPMHSSWALCLPVAGHS